MSQTSEEQFEQLVEIAEELREVFGARGHSVDVALSVDPAFTSGRSRSSLSRDLALSAIFAKASQVGMDFRSVNGEGKELRGGDGNVYRRYRLLRAKESATGEIAITANAQSSLSSECEEQGSLFPDEQWVFGWTLTTDGLIGQVFVCPVLGVSKGTPGHLLVGRLLHLHRAALPAGPGFRPATEYLAGFDDEDEEDSDGTTGATSA